MKSPVEQVSEKMFGYVNLTIEDVKNNPELFLSHKLTFDQYVEWYNWSQDLLTNSLNKSPEIKSYRKLNEILANNTDSIKKNKSDSIDIEKDLNTTNNNHSINSLSIKNSLTLKPTKQKSIKAYELPPVLSNKIYSMIGTTLNFKTTDQILDESSSIDKYKTINDLSIKKLSIDKSSKVWQKL
jgi:hypothetical protein